MAFVFLFRAWDEVRQAIIEEEGSDTSKFLPRFQNKNHPNEGWCEFLLGKFPQMFGIAYEGLLSVNTTLVARRYGSHNPSSWYIQSMTDYIGVTFIFFY
jgi:hypothetical protein